MAMPDRLRSALMDAGRRPAVAAGGNMGSPAERRLAMPEPAAALAAMKGEAAVRSVNDSCSVSVFLRASAFQPRQSSNAVKWKTLVAVVRGIVVALKPLSRQVGPGA